MQGPNTIRSYFFSIFDCFFFFFFFFFLLYPTHLSVCCLAAGWTCVYYRGIHRKILLTQRRSHMNVFFFIRILICFASVGTHEARWQNAWHLFGIGRIQCQICISCQSGLFAIHLADWIEDFFIRPVGNFNSNPNKIYPLFRRIRTTIVVHFSKCASTYLRIQHILPSLLFPIGTFGQCVAVEHMLMYCHDNRKQSGYWRQYKANFILLILIN